MGAAKEKTEKIEKPIEVDFYSTTTISKKVDRSTDTIVREIKAGRLKASTFNGNFAIKPKDFEEWKAKYFKPHVET